MEFVNFFTGQESRPRSCMESFVLLLSPMAPHISEELWKALGRSESLACASWPALDPGRVRESTVEIPVQINGRVRGRITVPAGATGSQMEQAALGDAKIQRHLEGHKVRKVILVPGKLINIVAG